MKFAVIDASAMVGLCAKEPNKYEKVMLAVSAYLAQNCQLVVPHVIVMEVLYVLCNKNKTGSLSDKQHAESVADFVETMELIEFPANGDIALAKRAEAIRQGRGCSHSADGLYLALAEELSASGTTELLTFDQGQAAALLPQISVKLLTP